jgi:murein endopeptidase
MKIMMIVLGLPVAQATNHDGHRIQLDASPDCKLQPATPSQRGCGGLMLSCFTHQKEFPFLLR